MQSSNLPSRKRRYWNGVAVAFVLACLIVDFRPHHGAPSFRYTGSDPAYPVWNLGWPLVLFIYDPRNGLHLAPIAYLVLPFQVFLVAVILLVMALRRRHDPPTQRTAMAPSGAAE